MAKPMPTVDRVVRLEHLRVRAALEREALAQNIAQVSRNLQPGNLFKSMLPRFISGQVPRLAWEAFHLLRRYPIVTSSLSALVMGKGRRFRLLRLTGGVFVVWQLFKAWQALRRG